MEKLLLLAGLLLLTPLAYANGNLNLASALPYPESRNDYYSSSTYNRGRIGDWYDLTAANGIESKATEGYECDYATALQAAANFQTINPSPAEFKWWLTNQDAVLAACDSGTAPSLVPPPGPGKRLTQEYAYHQAAQDFYRYINCCGEKTPPQPQTLPILRTMAYDTTHPRQRDAIFLYIRLLAKTKGAETAWNELDTLEHHPATAAVYPWVESLRFILITDNNTSLPYLRWLLSVVENKNHPETTLPEHMRAQFLQIRRNDALFHISPYLKSDPAASLEMFIPGSPQTPAPEAGWLATKQLIQNEHNNYLAWRQMNATPNPQPLARLSTHASEHVVEDMNTLATYALTQYQAGKGREWLSEAVRLAWPSHPQLQTMLTLGKSFLANQTLWMASPNRQFELYENLIWRNLESGNLKEATALFTMPSPQYPRYEYSSFTRKRNELLYKVLDWFLHQGETRTAHTLLLAVFPNVYTQSERPWETDDNLPIRAVLLAQTSQEGFAALAQVENIADDRIAPLLNVLSRQALYTFASTRPTLRAPTRDYFFRLAFTRAWLMNDRPLMQQAALQLDKLDDTGSKALLQAMEGTDTDLLRYILSHPRFRPVASLAGGTTAHHAETSIDSYKSNNNNWWCSYSPAENLNNAAISWKESLNPYDFENQKNTTYNTARQTSLQAHPFMALTNPAEQKMLASLPPAPIYLTQKVLKEVSSFGGLWVSRKEYVPEMLHLAVRATHYGCHSELPKYGKLSHLAYKLLHRHFGKTLWAQATPYWYGENLRENSRRTPHRP